MKRLGYSIAALGAALLLALPVWAEKGDTGKNGDAGRKGAGLLGVDTDGNGILTYDELKARFPRLTQEKFNQLDKDQSGSLTPGELPKGDQVRRDAGPGMFAKVDKDGNGRITLEEMTAAFPRMTPERFASLDKNGDHAVTPDELPKEELRGRGPMMAALVRQADADGNGQVTFEELQKVRPELTRERFDAMDRNNDGVLSEEDRAEADAQFGGGAGREARTDAARKLMKADADGDGQVTYEEVTAAKPGFPRDAFDRFDSNKDGVISPKDVPVH